MDTANESLIERRQGGKPELRWHDGTGCFPCAVPNHRDPTRYSASISARHRVELSYVLVRESV